MKGPFRGRFSQEGTPRKSHPPGTNKLPERFGLSPGEIADAFGNSRDPKAGFINGPLAELRRTFEQEHRVDLSSIDPGSPLGKKFEELRDQLAKRHGIDPTTFKRE